MAHALHASLLLFAPRHGPGLLADGFSARRPPPLAPGFPFPAHASHMRPCSSAPVQYRNLHLLSFGYASPPRLRPRLTQGRSALPWKPWIFGQGDSHPFLATHSGILPPRGSTPPCGAASSPRRCSPTGALRAPLSFGAVFQPRTFSARGFSTSELLRTL